MNIVILGAGMGKRMHSDLPKVLHRLAGRPLLSHVIETARALSPDRIIVIYGHGGDAVPTTFAAADLTFVLQEPLLGTGHALMQAMPHLDSSVPVLILYGDVPLIAASTLRRLKSLAGKDALGILTAEYADPAGLGRIVREQGEIVRIVEHRDASDSELAIREINTGVMLAPGDRLQGWLDRLSNDNAQGEYYLTDIVAHAVSDGSRIISAQPDNAWETMGINTKAHLSGLERIYQRNFAETLMAQGVTLADPARIDVRGTLVCGRDVFIDVNCVFEGHVVIGDGAIIGPNCFIRDTTLARDVEIRPFSHIDGATVGAWSSIGPYARLRPGADLGEEVQIGNFVEIKNSRVAAQSKANHLAYVGDSVVGQRVNIGAGTITSNYDGANKHETVIEDDAFIGTNCELVAPVRIGAGATIGAGTTLTKNVPANSLSISRVKQTFITNWKRPIKKS